MSYLANCNLTLLLACQCRPAARRAASAAAAPAAPLLCPNSFAPTTSDAPPILNTATTATVHSLALFLPPSPRPRRRPRHARLHVVDAAPTARPFRLRRLHLCALVLAHGLARARGIACDTPTQPATTRRWTCWATSCGRRWRSRSGCWTTRCVGWLVRRKPGWMRSRCKWGWWRVRSTLKW